MNIPPRLGYGLCRSCRRLRSFDFDFQDQKIAAFGSSYTGECISSGNQMGFGQSMKMCSRAKRRAR
ncbi:hypothetical protein E3W21_23225 [Pseudomonas sp. F01002]|nr:hypothetical protein E3W21_23225 [Pseudomonas sp. F01002]